jgi:purine-nucleoside phosphorylase
MDLYSRAKKIADRLIKEVNYVPHTAIVLGSGLGAFADSIEKDCEISYSDIEGFPVSTVPGHAGKLIFGTAGGKKIVAMQGRFHLYEGYHTDDVTLPIRVFQLMGIKNLIVTNAAGAVNTAYKPGDLMLICDHISFFCPSPLTGVNDDRLGTRFPAMDNAYSKKLIDVAKRAANECAIELKSGVYCYCKGPMFETPAEIRMIKSFGCDAAGMSTVPEVIAAVHGGLNVLGISCITNMAAGILDKPLSHAEVMETGKAVEDKFARLLNKVLYIAE